MFIGAHPDDIEFGCGGTVSKLINEGHQCIFIVATNGDQGSLDHDPNDLKNIRQAEAIASAKLLGVKDIQFLELNDGLTNYSLKDKIKLIELIRKFKPDTVFIHSKHDHHPDHKIIHELSHAAIKSATGPWFKDAKGKPHHVARVLGYEVWNPINEYQLAVDIGPYLDQKIAALKKHVSQVSNYPYIDAIKGLAQYRGAMINSRGHAEVFEVLRSEF